MLMQFTSEVVVPQKIAGPLISHFCCSVITSKNTSWGHALVSAPQLPWEWGLVIFIWEILLAGNSRLTFPLSMAYWYNSSPLNPTELPGLSFFNVFLGSLCMFSTRPFPKGTAIWGPWPTNPTMSVSNTQAPNVSSYQRNNSKTFRNLPPSWKKTTSDDVMAMYRFPTVSGGIWSSPPEIPCGPLTWKIQWLLRFHLRHLHLRTWSESMEKMGPSLIKTKDTTWKGYKYKGIIKFIEHGTYQLYTSTNEGMWDILNRESELIYIHNLYKCLFGARLEMKADNTKPTPCDRLKIKSQTI